MNAFILEKGRQNEFFRFTEVEEGVVKLQNSLLLRLVRSNIVTKFDRHSFNSP